MERPPPFLDIIAQNIPYRIEYSTKLFVVPSSLLHNRELAKPLSACLKEIIMGNMVYDVTVLNHITSIVTIDRGV